jgi:diguanylate cyclase (GGDEF)-like protein
VAAAAAVADLHSRSRQDLWLISALDPGTDAAQVVAVAGPWATRVAPGVVLSWAEALLARTVAVDGPVCEPDMQRAGSRPSAVDGREPFRAYLGLPLRTADGQVFGALCAANSRPRPARAMTDALRAAQVLGTLLSTIRAGEQFAADRSRDAVEAHALATRDQLTGLRNRHGWQDAVAAEQERCQRYGGAASVVVLDLDGLKTVNDRSGHGAGDRLLVAAGQALSSTCRPGDVLSRLGGDEFGILAVECDARAARALTRRLRVHLRTADVRVSLGCATRRHGETLVDTWQRADEAMYREKRTRRARLLTDVGRTPVEPAREPAGTGP